MSMESKANFINSVAEGKKILCPKCGTANESNHKFCILCGTELSIPAVSSDTPVFAPVDESTQGKENKKETNPEKKPILHEARSAAPAFAPVVENTKKQAEEDIKYVEPASAFADGLPSWDVVPPQVMVRRR